jgi:uncharacterized membrane protein YqhA
MNIPPQPWFPRLLFRSTMVAAGALVGLVLLSPLLPLDATHSATAKLWHLFANDDTLRQVAVVSAVGLWITAVVFFRSRSVNEQKTNEERRTKNEES